MQLKNSNSPGLADQTRQNVSAILAHALAEELRLSSTTRALYAMLPKFNSLHKLCAHQYRQLERWLEQLAFRSSALGATLQLDGMARTGAGAPGVRAAESDMIGELISRHEELAKQLQDDVQICSLELGDPGTAEILQQLGEFHETTAWMLRTVAGSVSNPAKSR